ncbi:MAG: dTDP-4-dehydrorhamnose 3,5-epimerase [Flavobacterium haoranii]
MAHYVVYDIYRNQTKKGCFILEPKIIKDERGYFMESFNEKTFQEGIGQKVTFVQDNQSFSTRGVLRSCITNVANMRKAKLVRVLQGEVLDVAVDLRPNSETYGQYEAVLLSGENRRSFLFQEVLHFSF